MLEKEFNRIFGKADLTYIEACGRIEIGGNHTDHNGGCVLAAAVNLPIYGAISKSDQFEINEYSIGYKINQVDLSDLSIKKDEKESSISLIRGVADGFIKRGYKIGGINMVTKSSVPRGVGLSSSAAYEVLIAKALNLLYNDDKIPFDELAAIAQYAEREYYGKPCGLMDQMASAAGGIIAVDFKDDKKPKVERLTFDFEEKGIDIVLVNTGGSHVDLTEEYASIPADMFKVANLMGKTKLRGLTRAQLMGNSQSIRKKAGDRAFLRALHFVAENERAILQKEALLNNDLDRFFQLVKESGGSSFNYLQNVYPSSKPQEQGISIALNIAQEVLKNKGAFRIHGGGFAGTVLAFVPKELTNRYIKDQQQVFGKSCCIVLQINQ